MAITRNAFTALLTGELDKVVVEVAKERPLEYPLVVNEVPMATNPVLSRQISGLGIMPPKPEGTAFAPDEPILGGSQTATAVPYGMVAEITWEMWRDELYGAMREIIGEMARAARFRKETDAWSPINDAFAGALFTAYDGLALAHTAHTRLDGGATQGNRPSPDIGFGVTGVQDAVMSFHRLKGHRGMPDLVSPVMFIIGPANVFAAREVLGSSGKPYTADNELNALIEEQQSWLVSHYLTTETHWHATAAKGVHGVYFGMRDDTMFDSFDDPRTKNGNYTMYQRHVPWVERWQGWYASTG